MQSYVWLIGALTALAATAQGATTQTQPTTPSATQLALDMYHGCLKDLSISCVRPKALQWFNAALQQNEVRLTDRLSVVRTAQQQPEASSTTGRALNAEQHQQQLFDRIDSYLASHALRIQAPEYFRSSEARALVPDYLLQNPLTQGGLIPLGAANEGRGMIRKAVLPFLLGLKLKTTVLMPLVLGLIALKTWKAMTLGLLSLVLSGALVIFKIAKPKIVNYEVVHYPHQVEHVVPHHIEHIVPHHIEHIVPHHIDHHLDHHLDHHVDLPVEHIEHLEHPSPAWDPHAWARSSQEPQDAQDMAYAAQKRR
ncbi:uncharacterized protein LOC6573160 [Drosophila mojavensis]|uniref:Osiris 18 n=1 Tax=Drosophila mojavensis TaxID=7230 RepID=B4KBN5_DROMO|nr:uncharacterized protein LOC6573160 [Drosophila mojavensis]EDW14712.1 uncharacterized protein Dmoj_GI24408 [Drosophila mojavensis]